MSRAPGFVILLTAALTLSCRAAPEPASPTPRPAGELRILMPDRPTSLNPNLELDEAAAVIGRNLFSHLVTVTETGAVIGELAESWRVSEDGLTYTFHLREGIRWHDGRPLTADDVKWSYEQIARDGWAREALRPVAGIECPDARTLVLRLRYRWAPLLSELTGFGLAVLPRHVFGNADWRTHPANQAPVGSGPFRFERIREDGSYELTANRDYFRPGPFVERLVFSDIDSSEAAFDQLASGAAHYSTLRPPLARLDTAAEHSGVRVSMLPSSGRIYAAFNHRRPPLDDVRVRRAIAASIDRLTLVEQVMYGHGAAAVGWYTPAVDWAYNPEARVPDFNPAAAERLLADAGLGAAGRNGLNLKIVTFDADPFTEIAAFVARALNARGIATSVEAVEPGDLPRRLLRDRAFDLVVLTGSHGPDPDALRQRFGQDGDADYIGYGNAEFRAALAAGASAADRAARAGAYFRAQQILAADVPFIPLVEAVKLVAHNDRVYGLPQLEAQDLVGVLDFSLVRLDAAVPDGKRR